MGIYNMTSETRVTHSTVGLTRSVIPLCRKQVVKPRVERLIVSRAAELETAETKMPIELEYLTVYIYGNQDSII
jgi:hypothetical protein